MDNFDFVEHLSDTWHKFQASTEIIKSFVCSYFGDLKSVSEKWHGVLCSDTLADDEAWSELRAVFNKYWLLNTRFAEYWEPAMCEPSDYEIAEDDVSVYMDMLGNFMVIVKTAKSNEAFLLSVIRDELRIVNQFMG